MGILGIGKGIVKMADGIIKGDAEKVIGGVKTTLINTATTIIFAGDDDDSDDDNDE